MLPFTNGKRRRESSNSVKYEAAEDTTLQHTLPTPPLFWSYLSGQNSSVSFASDVPRLFHGDSHGRKSEEACKQDLHSCAFFAKLNNAAEQHQTATTSHTHSPRVACQNDKTAKALAPVTTPPDINDETWKGCKATVESLEATLNATFRLPDSTPFVFSKDLRAAERALGDAKVAIKKASSRLDHHWSREHQRAKLRPMLDAQILLGQRIRRAYDEAEERRERMLGKVIEEEVKLESEDMRVLLDGLDEGWFGEEWEDVESV